MQRTSYAARFFRRKVQFFVTKTLQNDPKIAANPIETIREISLAITLGKFKDK